MIENIKFCVLCFVILIILWLFRLFKQNRIQNIFHIIKFHINQLKNFDLIIIILKFNYFN